MHIGHVIVVHFPVPGVSTTPFQRGFVCNIGVDMAAPYVVVCSPSSRVLHRFAHVPAQRLIHEDIEIKENEQLICLRGGTQQHHSWYSTGGAWCWPGVCCRDALEGAVAAI